MHVVIGHGGDNPCEWFFVFMNTAAVSLLSVFLWLFFECDDGAAHDVSVMAV